MATLEQRVRELESRVIEQEAELLALRQEVSEMWAAQALASLSLSRTKTTAGRALDQSARALLAAF